MDIRDWIRNWLPLGRRRAEPPSAGIGDVAPGEAIAAAAFHREGLAHLQQGALAEAARCFARAIELRHDFAAAHRDLGAVYERQEQLDDALDCYRLAVHFDPRLVPAQLGLGRVLTALGFRDQAVEACSFALDMTPCDAELHFALAAAVKARGDIANAVDHYRRGLELDPSSGEVHCNLCHALNELGRYDEARQYGEQAVRLDPGLGEAHHNLGLTFLALGRPGDAVQCFLRARAIKPMLPHIPAALAHAYRDLGQFEDARAAYDAALQVAPGFGDAVINRAYLFLMQGDFKQGWHEYEARFTATGTVERDFFLPRWQGESLARKTVLVHAEQGIGDEIMFASCLPELITGSGRVVIECSERLAGLFLRSFPQAHVHGGKKEAPPDWVAGVGSVDYQVPIGSLPRFFRPAPEAFPRHAGYLHPDPACVSRWRTRLQTLGSRFCIGLSWRGGTYKTGMRLRSVPLSELAPILQRQDAAFVSLQHDVPHDCHEAHLAEKLGIHVFPAITDDLEELAGLVGALDLIVSVDNTNVHLAGALGRPVWVLLSRSPESRYLRAGDEMPWYPSARLFRQPLAGDWAPVLDAVAGALTMYVHGHHVHDTGWRGAGPDVAR